MVSAVLRGGTSAHSGACRGGETPKPPCTPSRMLPPPAELTEPTGAGLWRPSGACHRVFGGEQAGNNGRGVGGCGNKDTAWASEGRCLDVATVAGHLWLGGGGRRRGVSRRAARGARAGLETGRSCVSKQSSPTAGKCDLGRSPARDPLCEMGVAFQLLGLCNLHGVVVFPSAPALSG